MLVGFILVCLDKHKIRDFFLNSKFMGKGGGGFLENGSTLLLGFILIFHFSSVFSCCMFEIRRISWLSNIFKVVILTFCHTSEFVWEKWTRNAPSCGLATLLLLTEGETSCFMMILNYTGKCRYINVTVS